MPAKSSKPKMARSAAQAAGKTYISPYNDPLVVAGQEHFDRVATTIGSYRCDLHRGGRRRLNRRRGCVLKATSPRTRVVGCWPANSRVMYQCLRAGEIIGFAAATLSESTAGGVEAGSITFDLCRQVIDECVLVSEAEILKAMRWAHARDWPVEGAAAVAIAAFCKEAGRHNGQTVVIVCCGGNTSPEVLGCL